MLISYLLKFLKDFRSVDGGRYKIARSGRLYAIFNNLNNIVVVISVVKVFKDLKLSSITFKRVEIITVTVSQNHI